MDKRLPAENENTVAQNKRSMQKRRGVFSFLMLPSVILVCLFGWALTYFGSKKKINENNYTSKNQTSFFFAKPGVMCTLQSDYYDRNIRNVLCQESNTLQVLA